MQDPTYAMAIGTFAPMLQSLSKLLDKGAEHARDPNALTGARLAPDMYTLAQQVQLACHHAEDGAGRLMGQAPRPLETSEQSMAALQAAIAKTIDDLKAAPQAAFEDAADRTITIPISDDTAFEMNGLQFLRDWALPHFYFHVVTAYDILRHQGAEIGKRDYLSHVGGYIRPRRS
jgi:hypothetical protein